MKRQENINYCLGDALMEERSCQAKWVIRTKLEAISKVINENEFKGFNSCVLDSKETKLIRMYLQDILNIVENEL